MDTVTIDGRTYRFDRAAREDVPTLVALLRDDVLGAGCEKSQVAPYDAAFALVDADPAHHLLAMRREDGQVVGTLQATVLPGLSRGGATRLLIEAVRVDRSERGSGLGSAMFEWAHAWGRARGATLAQLTTDTSRTDAQRFYERLGYEATHTGMKRPI
ncbi:GNAT family N-acetyltransferase [Allobranchiibius sp. CTAmp26]|uniref:GNAT family N-acetyltransferase n=1 Tax=Allobranchiibius sp. CTAmp26 TaxID=2815214 RepID=UPI001AA0C5DF|nr:GNAT family N-acetyltransferase [Allobranchiibius sp. CTAmp26]MBO1755074.1 GNAT family N-acetyltransferase [Allobranchiibius sp. CTAmp26]